jgi:hypothetical protein
MGLLCAFPSLFPLVLGLAHFYVLLLWRVCECLVFFGQGKAKENFVLYFMKTSLKY